VSTIAATDDLFLDSARQALQRASGSDDVLSSLGWWDLLESLDDPEARTALFALFRAQGRELVTTAALGALLAHPYVDTAPGAVTATIPRGSTLFVLGNPGDRLLVDRPDQGATLIDAGAVTLTPLAVPGEVALQRVTLAPDPVGPPPTDQATAEPDGHTRHPDRAVADLDLDGPADTDGAITGSTRPSSQHPDRAVADLDLDGPADTDRTTAGSTRPSSQHLDWVAADLAGPPTTAEPALGDTRHLNLDGSPTTAEPDGNTRRGGLDGPADTDRTTTGSTRPSSQHLDSVAADLGGPVDIGEGIAEAARRRSLFLGRVALAFDMLGAAEAALALATEHALAREQFGQPIARFQAVRHLLAWATTDCAAIEAVAQRAVALDEAAPAGFDEVVKALAGRNARRACERTLQVMGAIGFTAEHDHHRFHSRVLALDALLGSSAELTRRLGTRVRKQQTGLDLPARLLAAAEQ